jgi:hypothetical protein
MCVPLYRCSHIEREWRGQEKEPFRAHSSEPVLFYYKSFFFLNRGSQGKALFRAHSSEPPFVLTINLVLIFFNGGSQEKAPFRAHRSEPVFV